MIELLKEKKILIVLSICFFNFCFSQVEEQKKNASKTIYEKADDFSGKSKIAKLLYRLIVKSKKAPETKSITTQKQDYGAFEGKIIREIKVESHDPFGFSLKDSTQKANKWIEKTGNNLHTKSKGFAIKNFLIFKKNSPLDSLKLIESERLIRSQRFIRSVDITVKAIEQSPDSVDVYITTLDSWSLVPNGSISNSKMKLQLTEQNFLGFGHDVRVTVKNQFSNGKTANDLRYSIPNFKHTYISSTLGYSSDLDESYSKRFDIRRSFFSPFTKWAAGIYLDEKFTRKLLPDNNMIFNSQNFKYQSQDVWAGYSFSLLKGGSERQRTANIITAFRWLNIDFKEMPTIVYDNIHYFSNETFYLGSIGISSRQFIEDSYIFRDGIIENVPVGDIYSITLGKHYKNNGDRLYLGAKIAHGNYYKWGYLSANFEYGTFLKKSEFEQTAYSFSVNYFTNLIDLGNTWKMRQFIKPQFIIGKNRLNSIGDRVTIDETNDFQNFYGTEKQRKNSYGIPGFESGLLGTSKYLLSLQTQFYPPWRVIGFRFNPFINMNVAMLSDEESRVINGKLYSSFGVGLIIRNDYLVFNSLQLSLNFYPTIPGEGNNIFNANTINTDDFGLQGFQVGKPSPVWFN